MQTYYYFHKQLNKYVLVAHIDNESKVREWFAGKGYPTLHCKCIDGTFRVVLPNDDKVIKPIMNKFESGVDPTQLTTYTEWTNQTTLKLVVPKENTQKVINWLNKLHAEYSIGHASNYTIFLIKSGNAIAALVKKYPPINPAPQPQPTAQPAKAKIANAVVPRQLTAEELTKALGYYSHYRLNRIALDRGLGDLSHLNKADKIKAIVTTAIALRVA